ncbi:MAG: flagellar biosynthesis protein FlhF [Aeromonadaceae bacterium]
MKIKRFFAKDMRTALAEVKETLGPDAVIMSNKKVSGGIEIVAAVDYQSQTAAPAMEIKREVRDDNVKLSTHSRAAENFASHLALNSQKHDDGETFPDSLSALLARQQPKGNGQLGAMESGVPRTLAEQAQFAEPREAGRRPIHARGASAVATPARDKEMESMRAELTSIRKLLQHQLSGLMWQEVERREPVRALLIKQLVKGGFDDAFAEQLAALIPEEVPLHEAWGLLQRVLTEQVRTGEDDILRHGGAVALLGPTGVGKTTTIAKLAARFAMKYGAEQVALITTDHYRIGAHEQLQTYGRIMGCLVRPVADVEELSAALYQLRNRRLVLIDTAGMGQRDVRLTEQLDTLVKNAKVRIRNYLVLPATSQRRVLQEAYEHFRRVPLSGCILTKLDESLNLGDVLSMCIKNALPISYVTDGQRVPEDLQVANASELVAATLRQLEDERTQNHFWGHEGDRADHMEFYE